MLHKDFLSPMEKRSDQRYPGVVPGHSWCELRRVARKSLDSVPERGNWQRGPWPWPTASLRCTCLAHEIGHSPASMTLPKSVPAAACAWGGTAAHGAARLERTVLSPSFCHHFLRILRHPSAQISAAAMDGGDCMSGRARRPAQAWQVRMLTACVYAFVLYEGRTKTCSIAHASDENDRPFLSITCHRM